VKTGARTAYPVAITLEQEREREIASLRRSLEGVDHRLAHVDDDDRFPWESEPPTAEQVERKRAGLDAEREFVVSKLAELDPPKKGAKR
jgi:hypothetical protein